MKLKASIMHETAMIMGALCLRRDKNSKRHYLNVIKFKEEQEIDAWTGKMNETKSQILKVRSDIASVEAKIEAKIDAKIDNVEAKIANVKSDIANVKSDIEAKIDAKIDDLIKLIKNE